ncbi:hypothetical protein BS78_04G146400 [Paspalum vaginatum]|nr:hypothetical protein BS78_04G146400 [Paspalum vaginatum]
MSTAMAGGIARAGAVSLVLLFVALAGIADLASAAGGPSATTTVAFSGGDDSNDAGALLTATPTPPSASPAELSGFIECMLGCFTQVFGCSFGCMGKGPDLPLCVISCDQKSVVCMIRCGLAPSPSPPKPSPPGPKPPSPKPPKPPTPKPPAPTPKPPAPAPPTPAPPTPAPPYTPPYAVNGRKTATSA